MTIEVQLELHPDSTTEYTLGGTAILIRNRWSSRNNNWSIDILETTGVEIISGLTLLPEQNLTSIYVDPRLPSGDLTVVGTLPTDDDLKFDALGDTMKLMYVTIEELTS